jgi:uncharacterized RDD family membrane protein YckC
MKCPKCDYLGFDTSDRCRNCGYDFSLMVAAPDVPDLALRLPEEQENAAQPEWLDRLDGALGESHATRADAPDRGAKLPQAPAGRSGQRPAGYTPPAPLRQGPPPDRPAVAGTPTLQSFDSPAPGRPAPVVPDLSLEPPMPPPAFRGEPALPLFSPASDDDDQPLIRVPAAPRAPLSVRRTPDAPRLRAARTVDKPAPEPTLQFADELQPDEEQSTPVRRAAATHPRSSLAQAALCSPGARALAAVLDYAILGAIDALVLYFTLRLAGLTMAEWQAIPALPMIAFLLLLKVAYFTAFTTIGGQTIGKMAAGIRVVSDEDDFVDPTRAVRRALAGVVSLLTLGIGFVPGLFGADRRALHDRLAHTRVVALPSA